VVGVFVLCSFYKGQTDGVYDAQKQKGRGTPNTCSPFSTLFLFVCLPGFSFSRFCPKLPPVLIQRHSFSLQPIFLFFFFYNIHQNLPSLTDNKLVALAKVVGGDLEVERGGAFSDAARDVVVGTVAGTEPATVLAGLADGNATQVGADT